jgi:2-amino-4-hydroxy-6-hydroxymethyldihydropteridine diphosphokinase
MARVFLGLGSNLGDRRSRMRGAVEALMRHGIEVKRASSLYESEPMYELDQPRFLNAVIEVETELSPEELLRVAKGIERQLGRQRRHRNGPREIDIDILRYGGVQLDTPELTIPHPRMAERPFVLEPLGELADDVSPNSGRPSGVQRIEGREWANMPGRRDASLRTE